jgi:Fe-S-cluster containining protein
MIERGEELRGRRLAQGEIFRFRCRPGLSCFNSCCRDKRLGLYPYDLLRLRRALSLTAAEVLERHVELELDPESGWPAPRLRLLEDGRCPFVTPQGCGVYPHRPTCCRIFPLTRAVARGGGEELYLAEEHPGCLGWREPHELTVQGWIEEQGLAAYQRANNRASAFFLHPRRRRPMALSERQLHGVLMALYNLEVFAELVARADFAPRFGLPRERTELALASDEALLELGLDWLTSQFFGD